MLATREQILGAADLPSEDVAVPEWGADAEVRLTAMSRSRRAAFDAALAERGGDAVVQNEAYAALVLAYTAVDASGALLFQPEDLPALSDKHPGVLLRLTQRAAALSMDAIRGNSAGEPMAASADAASSSSSPND